MKTQNVGRNEVAGVGSRQIWPRKGNKIGGGFIYLFIGGVIAEKKLKTTDIK